MTCNIKYTETGFMIDCPENWHTLHQHVHDLLFAGMNSPDGRTFIYSVLDSPELEGSCLVSVRAHGEIASSIPVEVRESEFTQGQSLDFNVDISLQRSTSRFKGSKKVSQASKHVRPYEMEDWMRKKASAIGFDAERISWGPIKRRYVSKSGTEFFIPCAVFRVSGTVSDPKSFSQAWLHGIGRNKGYGLGLLERVAR